MRRVVIGLAVAAGLLFLSWDTVLTAAGSYLVAAGPPMKADIGLVLAGDGRGSRILTGAKLVRDGYIPKLMVSGPDGNYQLHECDLAIPFAVNAGFPESYFVHFENSARNTRDEAVQAAAEMRKMGAHSLLLITSDYHTRRALNMYREAAPDLEIHVVGAPDLYFSADGWWHNREGQKTAFYEWLKTVASWVNL